jgi:hypothetical protein
MKKLIILFVFAVVAGLNFTSCSSDDDNTSSTSIEGKWNFSKFSTTVNGVTSPEMDYEGNETGCPKDFIEIKTGGVFVDGDYSGSSCTLDSFTGTWAKSGNTLTITAESETFTVELISVTSSSMKIKSSETFNGETVIVNMTFTRV